MIPGVLGFPRALALAGLLSAWSALSAATGVAVYETNNVIRVDLNGERFTEYHFRDVSRPFLFPLLGAEGQHFSRQWPMAEPGGEEKDHPHHRSLWWSHGEANGVDFWSESAQAGRTVHQSFAQLRSGPKDGAITARNHWVAKDGKVIASDERTMRFHAPEGPARLLDFSITIFASHGDLVLGDTKEGTMAIRLAESMRLSQPKGRPAEGRIVNADGIRNGATWGKRSPWVDYVGPVQGQTVGVAIFDHPENPRFPTWWHVRDYGLFAANPFGVHDFEKKEKGVGDLKISNGESVTFRYRFYLHPGDTEAARVADRYAAWVKEPLP